MTIEEAYNNFISQLKTVYEEREAANIADWVFEYEGIKRLDRITNRRKALGNSAVEQFDKKLLELLQHKPAQYVLQEAWFYKMKFYVDENVLIPRPETEELVEWVVCEVKMKNEKLKILDIGSGSGCIPIAIKKEVPGVEIISVDISDNALAVAKQNAELHKTDIEFIQLDFLNEDLWNSLLPFDIIVSNPPYIPENEKAKLAKNVTDYEPHLALFTEDEDPFIFYKKITLFAKSHLNENGKIFVEVHENFAVEISKIFDAQNFKTEIRKDIYRRERMIKVIK